MAQISPPLRILLGVALAFAAVWMIALRPKPASPDVSVATPAPVAAPATPAPARRQPPAARPSTTIVPPATAEALRQIGPVRRALAAGDVVALLFWDPRGPVDRAVRRELLAAKAGHKQDVTYVTTTVGHLARYGRITRAVRVLGTPTLIIVDRARKARAISGFTERLPIQQALADALRAKPQPVAP